MPDPLFSGSAVRDQNIVLGFDFGEVRIGIAVGNRVTFSASPLRIITGNSNDAKFKQIEVIVKEWQPSTLVVGRPLHPDGNPHEMTLRCERFARQLEGRFGIAVAMTDERYTSAVTNSDSEAAAAILQQYLQS
jgi:putative holliday junction resolvase